MSKVLAFSLLFLAGTGLGYWLVFTYRFFEGVLPHGGLW
jgi:hypothetical protein